MRVNAYAAPAAGQPLAPIAIERRDVGPNDVLIEIKYAGICHSDIHTVRGDWGPQPFPLVPGHEIVGVVTEVGSDVTKPPVGDRVGVGCMVNSCRECANCRRGDEQYCLERQWSAPTPPSDRDGTTTQGGYSTHVVVDADFVLRIPEGIDPDAAAPLLCAGITTYSPLRHWGAGPGKKVAVVGLGGLGPHGRQDRPRHGRRGHGALAVAEEAGGRPAPRRRPLLRHQRPDNLRAAGRSVRPDRQHRQRQHRPRRLPRLLAVDGTLVNVGAPAEPLSVNVFSLIGARRSFAGSMIGGIPETQEMLDFCAEHGIGAEIEVIAADKINEAYERVLASDVRYRFVIDTATL